MSLLGTRMLLHTREAVDMLYHPEIEMEIPGAIHFAPGDARKIGTQVDLQNTSGTTSNGSSSEPCTYPPKSLSEPHPGVISSYHETTSGVSTLLCYNEVKLIILNKGSSPPKPYRAPMATEFRRYFRSALCLRTVTMMSYLINSSHD
jgi:hypothetical protein